MQVKEEKNVSLASEVADANVTRAQAAEVEHVQNAVERRNTMSHLLTAGSGLRAAAVIYMARSRVLPVTVQGKYIVRHALAENKAASHAKVLVALSTH